jgi:CelD/BcsL family acetyltransferase involved in cellulose biosynthesis
VLKAVETKTLPQTMAAPQGARPGVLPPGCNLSLATTLRSLARLETPWRQLESQCAKPPRVFQTFDWVNNWCQIYANPDSAKDIHIIVGRRGNEVVFIWPLVRHPHRGLRVLTWASHPIGQYGDLLLHHAENAEQWISAATAYLKSINAADILHLRHVREDANFAPHAKAHWNDGKLYECAPALDLTPFNSDEEYSQRYDSQQRKRRKKSQRKMEEALGPLTIARLESGPAVEAAIDFAIAEKLKWLEARGRFNQVLACPSHKQFLTGLRTNANAPLRVVVMQIALGDTPAAWEVGFESRGIHYGYITAHREGLTDYGIGRLTLDAAQRQALAAGMAEYDLMVPYDPHKESFSSRKVPVNDWFMPLTTRGKVYGHLYLGLARPLLRRLYLHLPTPVLRVLKHLLRQ